MSHQSHQDGVRMIRGVCNGVVMEILFIIAFVGIGNLARCEELPAAPAIAPMAVSAPRQPITAPFLSSGMNRSLVAGDFAARVMDAVSTRYYEKHDYGHETEEPAFIAHSYKTQLPVSLGEAAVNACIASKLWSHHHERMARTLLMVDIGGEGFTDAHNYTLKRRVK